MVLTLYSSTAGMFNCIESVRELGFELYENIIVGDGSSDDTSVFINSLSDSNLVYVKSTEILTCSFDVTKATSRIRNFIIFLRSLLYELSMSQNSRVHSA